jgi:hypothetical protein
LEPEPHKSKNKTVLYGLPIGLLIAIVLAALHFTDKKDPFQRIIEITSAEVNKTCPVMQDSDTRLESTEALPDKVFQYNYTLVQTYRDSIDVEMLYVGFLEAMRENARVNPELEIFRKNKVTFSYHFKDKLGKFVTRIQIKPEDYK